MTEPLTVRDHNHPCEHYDKEAERGKQGWVHPYSGWWYCQKGLCPGGREIVLQAAEGEWWGGFVDNNRPELWYWEYWVWDPKTHAVYGDKRVEVPSDD